MDFDFGTLIFFAAFLWFLVSEMRPKKKPPRPNPQPRPELSSRRGPEPPRTYDAELERRRLERLLKGLDPDGGPIIVSLETEPERPERDLTSYDDVAVSPDASRSDEAGSYDDRAAAASRARIAAARARDAALTDADHAAFDRRIRRLGTPQQRARRPHVDLRNAVVWREVLGPPVSLRDEQA